MGFKVLPKISTKKWVVAPGFEPGISVKRARDKHHNTLVPLNLEIRYVGRLEVRLKGYKGRVLIRLDLRASTKHIKLCRHCSKNASL